MSQEDVELVRRACEAAMRRPPDLDTMNELFDPSHELVSLLDAVDGGSRQGMAGYLRWVDDVDDFSAEWAVQIGEISEVAENRFLVITPTTFRARASGIDLGEQRLACIATVRGGKLVRTEVYASEADARAAVSRSR